MEDDLLRDASLIYILAICQSVINHTTPLLCVLFAFLMTESFVFYFWMIFMLYTLKFKYIMVILIELFKYAISASKID